MHQSRRTLFDVQVIGHQFWWEIRYPKYGIVTANEMHVPVSLKEHPTPTFLDLRVGGRGPQFLGASACRKDELVPNKVNTMWIDPERTGLFLGQCAKYCGTQHSWMLLRVYVDTPEEFARCWSSKKHRRQASRRLWPGGAYSSETPASIVMPSMGRSALADSVPI